MDRYLNVKETVEIAFPAHAYIGECLGVCSVPTGVSVEEALRLLRRIGVMPSNKANPEWLANGERSAQSVCIPSRT